MCQSFPCGIEVFRFVSLPPPPFPPEGHPRHTCLLLPQRPLKQRGRPPSCPEPGGLCADERLELRHGHLCVRNQGSQTTGLSEVLRSDAYFIPRVVRQHSLNPSSEAVTDSTRGVVTGYISTQIGWRALMSATKSTEQPAVAVGVEDGQDDGSRDRSTSRLTGSCRKNEHSVGGQDRPCQHPTLVTPARCGWCASVVLVCCVCLRLFLPTRAALSPHTRSWHYFLLFYLQITT